jgi:hypothetical protein
MLKGMLDSRLCEQLGCTKPLCADSISAYAINPDLPRVCQTHWGAVCHDAGCKRLACQRSHDSRAAFARANGGYSLSVTVLACETHFRDVEAAALLAKAKAAPKVKPAQPDSESDSEDENNVCPKCGDPVCKASNEAYEGNSDLPLLCAKHWDEYNADDCKECGKNTYECDCDGEEDVCEGCDEYETDCTCDDEAVSCSKCAKTACKESTDAFAVGRNVPLLCETHWKAYFAPVSAKAGDKRSATAAPATAEQTPAKKQKLSAADAAKKAQWAEEYSAVMFFLTHPCDETVARVCKHVTADVAMGLVVANYFRVMEDLAKIRRAQENATPPRTLSFYCKLLSESYAAKRIATASSSK